MNSNNDIMIFFWILCVIHFFFFWKTLFWVIKIHPLFSLWCSSMLIYFVRILICKNRTFLGCWPLVLGLILYSKFNKEILKACLLHFKQSVWHIHLFYYHFNPLQMLTTSDPISLFIDSILFDLQTTIMCISIIPIYVASHN